MFCVTPHSNPNTPRKQTTTYPIAIISRGGSSLGNYQAGYHYYLVEWLKERKEYFELKIVTGSSAGAINSLLSALSVAHTNPQRIPENSNHYKAWIPFDLHLCTDNKNALSLLNRDIITRYSTLLVDSIISENIHLNADLDLIVGITATYLTPLKERINGLNVTRVEEKFPIYMQKKGKNPYMFRNYIYDSLNVLQPVLPFNHNRTADILISLLTSSTTQPIIFQPVTMQSKWVNTTTASGARWDSDNLWDELHDSMSTLASHTFIDGGLFDNHPISFAYNQAKYGLHDTILESGEQRIQWRSNPTMKTVNTFVVDSLMKYIYVDPTNFHYPLFKNEQTIDQYNFLKFFKKSIGTIAEAARHIELYTFVKSTHGISERNLFPTKNYVPILSKHLGNSFGFFDRNIREFDFYLGMYEAEKYGQTIDPILINLFGTMRLQNSLQRIDDCINKKKSYVVKNKPYFESKEYLCLRSVFDELFDQVNSTYTRTIPDVSHLGKEADYCEQCTNEQFKKLVQTSIDILWFHWKIASEQPAIVLNIDTGSIEYKKWYYAITNSPTWPSVWGVTAVNKKRNDKPNPKIKKRRGNRIKTKLAMNKYRVNTVKRSFQKKNGFDGMLYLLSSYDFNFINYNNTDNYHKVKSNINLDFQYLFDNLANNNKNLFNKLFLKFTSRRMLNISNSSIHPFYFYLSSGQSGSNFGISLGTFIRFDIHFTTLKTFKNNWEICNSAGLELVLLNNALLQVRSSLSTNFATIIKPNNEQKKNVMFYIGFLTPKITVTLFEFLYVSYQTKNIYWTTYFDYKKKFEEEYRTLDSGIQFGIQLSPRFFR